MSKRVLITGGNRGIGLAITEYFVDRGYEVVVVGRDFSNFNIEGVQTITFDLNHVEKIDEIVEQAGDVDILINNAGICSRNFVISDYSADKVDEMINVNLKAPVELIKKYAEIFKKKGGGRIVNIASQAGEIGHDDVWYGITKAGLLNASKSFASIYGKDGIVINSVSPGPVDTIEKKEGARLDRFTKLTNRTYLKRVVKRVEVANVVGYLAIDAPEYLNGENVDLNNGAQRLAK